MNIDVIAKVFGILGFFISVATFALTRFERRKRLEIEVSDATIHDFYSDGTANMRDDSMVRVRITNIGPTSVIIKPRTLTIESNGRKYNLDQRDFVTKDSFKELVPPDSVREIGISLSDVDKELKIENPSEKDNSHLYKLIPIKITIKDHLGKKFTTNRFKYHVAVGQFVT